MQLNGITKPKFTNRKPQFKDPITTSTPKNAMLKSRTVPGTRAGINYIQELE